MKDTESRWGPIFTTLHFVSGFSFIRAVSCTQQIFSGAPASQRNPIPIWESKGKPMNNLSPRVSLLRLRYRWEKDPDGGWSRDYLRHKHFHRRRVSEYILSSSTEGKERRSVVIISILVNHTRTNTPLRRQRKETLGTRLSHEFSHAHHG